MVGWRKISTCVAMGMGRGEVKAMPIFRRLPRLFSGMDTHVTLDDHSVSKVVETVKSIKHRLDERKYVKDFILAIFTTFAFILLFSIAELSLFTSSSFFG